MFKVYLTNIGHYLNNNQPYPSLDEAKTAGRKTGFEFTVLTPEEKLIGFHTTFGGWHDYNGVPCA